MSQSRVFQAGVTSKRVRIFIQDSTTFMGKTGLAFGTVGLTFYYSNGPGDTAHAIALVTNTIGGAYSSGGFKEVDSANQPGWYQFDIPNAAIASGNGNEAQIVWKGTGVLDGALDVELTGYDPDSIDKSNFTLSAAGISAIWAQLVAAMVTANSVGKLLADNIAGTKTATAAIQVKTDLLAVDSSGRVKLQPTGLDAIPGYHPAGDA